MELSKNEIKKEIKSDAKNEIKNSEKQVVEFDDFKRRRFTVNVSGKEFVHDNIKLLSVSAQAYAGRCEVLNDEVITEGCVRFTAVYSDSEGKIASCTHTERFSQSESVTGVNGKTVSFAKCAINKVKGYNEAGNLMFTATVDVLSVMIVPRETQILKAGEGIKKREESLKLTKCVFSKQLRFSTSEESELSPRLPEAESILSVTAYCQVNETRFSAGQLIIGGEIQVQTVYASKDEYEPVVQITDRFAFSRITDINGDISDTLNGNTDLSDIYVYLTVEEITADISADSDGEMRKIEYTFDLCGYGYAQKTKECIFITDAYSVTNKLKLKNEKFLFCGENREIKAKSSRNFTLTMPENKPVISRIGAVYFMPDVTECERQGNRTAVKGNGEVSVIYQSAETGETEGFSVNIPVEFSLDGVESIGSEIASGEITDLQAVQISGREIELRCETECTVSASEEREKEIVCDGEDMGALDMPEYGIVIYTVGRNDTLWDICKKFGIDENDIREINPDIENEPKEGEKIYIFRPLAV